MYYIIKKNQKKLMAIFAVLLMISFVATFSVGRAGGGGQRSNPVVGHMGKTPIYDSQVRDAREEWAWLSRYQFRSVIGQPMKLPAHLIADAITGGQGMAPMMFQFQAENIGDQAVETIDQHPEAFLLLKLEAIQDGLNVTPDEANSFLKNAMGMTINNDNSLATSAVQDAMLIGRELAHLKEAIKVSQPLWQHDAVETQSVRLNILDFRASDFQKGIPAPTTQQVQQQFERFKDVPPHDTSPSNPLGFGYQIPARVKLQYIEIPHAEVVEAVIRTVHPSGSAEAALGASDPQYDWEVQAAAYYNAHPEEFKSAPQTQPTSRASRLQTVTSQPTTEETAASRPTIKPFNEVKHEILDKLAAPQAEALAKQIADDVAARLASDFQTIRQADPAAVIPSTQPTTQLAAATSQPTTNLMMLAHLEQIRDQIQQKYHVAIQLHDIVNDWLTQADLAKLPGIGDATGPEDAKFPELATSFTRLAPSLKGEALQLWQPSPLLNDGQQNAYLFRLTAAQPPHAPPEVAPVAKQIEADWKLAQAYDQAMEAAQKAYASAKTVGISQAARNAGLQPISTPLFQPTRAQEIPGYPLGNPAAQQMALKAASDLLAQATPSDKHPDSLVPLPSALRVAVMELAAAQLPQPEWIVQFGVTRNQQMEQVERLAADWFNYDLILTRTGYKPEQKT